MSATPEYTVWCDFCNEWHAQGDATTTAKAAREFAKRAGWTQINLAGVMTDACPTCRKILGK